MEDPLKSAKASVALVSDIIKAAGDNPNVREAGNNLGQAALTLTKTINNVLLPLAALNFAVEKARVYFDTKFALELAEKASKIPPKDIVEPKATIAGPALQGLAFSHEEKSLRDMYLNLLATAMDGRLAIEAHPAFVEIIKQLDGEEARLLPEFLQPDTFVAIAQVRETNSYGHGYAIVSNYLVNFKENGEPVLVPRGAAMVDNWIRLGLLKADYERHLIASHDNYHWVETRPEYKDLLEQARISNCTLSYEKGMIWRTAFGAQFAHAVGMQGEH
ncbi:MAG TPA: DUF4393 domain-containing protein [Telluria sp.]